MKHTQGSEWIGAHKIPFPILQLLTSKYRMVGV